LDARLGFLLDMGVALLEAGAETARAEETVLRLGRALGFSFVEALMTPSGVWVSVAEGDSPPLTSLRRVERRTLALDRLVALNELSRAVTAGAVSAAEAASHLQRITTAPPPYPRSIALLGGGLAATGFAGLIGANGSEALAAFILGLAATRLRQGFRGPFADRFLVTVLGGFTSGFLGSLGRLLPSLPLRPDVLIPAGIVVLVPGIQLANAIRDVLQGDLISAASLGLEALVLALGLAGGVATGVGLVIWGRGVV
jgi:uncharacterized membrane protein YjjP (DUF1212 family)